MLKKTIDLVILDSRFFDKEVKMPIKLLLAENFF